MIYYARPFSYNPVEARKLYKEESEILHETTGELIVCSIPLTDYNITFDVEEAVMLKIATPLIENSDLLVYNGMSRGVAEEIEIAQSRGIPVVDYDTFLKQNLRRQAV